MSDAEIEFSVVGNVGRILLNRPKALNALTLNMCQLLLPQLRAWKNDPAIKAVVVVGAGEKAFCAGGDVVRLYEDGKARKPYPREFWSTEYRCNVLIKRFPKPYIALIDGIVMGGGVGLSLHGRYRVAGERYRFAMPEVGIGFFPDVGATYALPRLPHLTGLYLALTGAQAGPDDAATLGLATHLVPSADMASLLDRLAAGDPIDAAIARFVLSSRPGPIAGESDLIESCFSAASLSELLGRLGAAAGQGSAFAGSALETM